MDILTKKQRSYCMSKVKGKNTKIETIFRKYIWEKGVKGYRVNNRKITGKPDLFFGQQKLAVFIDGCFWHKCPECFSPPTGNFGFWDEKLTGNVNRDKEVNKLLKGKDIRVIRFWEHEVEKNLDKCYKRLVKELKVK